MTENFADNIAADLEQGHVLELAELYAMDALEPAEQNQVERYISTAPQGIAEQFWRRAEGTREVLSRAYAPTSVSVPGDLFARIQSRLPEAAPATGELALDELSRRREQKRQACDYNQQPTFGKQSRRGWKTWVVAAVAAALVIAGGVGLSNVLNHQETADQVAAAPDARTMHVQVQGGGTATVSVSASMNAAAVQLDGVPTPAQGSTYQLWMMPKGDGGPKSVGLMTSDQDMGKAAMVDGISTAKALAITVEPRGGSTKPTTIPIMMAEIKS